MDLATSLGLSRDDLIALIELQGQQILALTERVKILQAKLAAPPKTPEKSSVPPSKGQKPKLPETGKKKPRTGRPGVTRTLADHLDKIIEATLAACPHCDHALAPADMNDFHAYDHANLPPISAIVTRINCNPVICPLGRKHVKARAPDGFEPFGRDGSAGD